MILDKIDMPRVTLTNDNKVYKSSILEDGYIYISCGIQEYNCFRMVHINDITSES